MTPNIDLYVFLERYVFETDAQWLNAMSALTSLDVPGFAVQVRTKSEAPAKALNLAREARSVTLDAVVPVLYNGTTAEATALGYTGVHWPEAVVPRVREGMPILRGASVHSVEATTMATIAGADFIVAGTIYDAGSKDARGEGIEKLRTIAKSARLPVLAIGGITPERVKPCIEAGAAGVASISNILKAPDMAQAVRDLREALDEAKAGAAGIDPQGGSA